jgi:hypothetical protein
LAGVGLWAGRLWSGAAHPARPKVEAALATEDSHHRTAPADESAAPNNTSLLFHSLSGGEQEGVLDLLEEQSSDGAQVSI